MKMFRNLKAIIFVAALGLVGLLSGCGTTSNDVAAADTPIAETQPSNILNAITGRGAVESAETRNVYSMHGLRAERVYVEVGSQVTEGQVLAVFDTADLEFAIEQQVAALSLARQNNQTAISDAERMLEMANRNLSNNTNVMILHAEANLSAAETSVTEAQRHHDIAVRDKGDGNDLQILNAEIVLQQTESAVISARADLTIATDTNERLQIMYDEGFLTREELRQSETTLTAAQNRYNDAQASYENATTAQGYTIAVQGRSAERTVEQTEIALQSARANRQTAQTLLSAERAAAQQEVELLNATLTSAEASTNVEQMEIALRQLERQLEDATITAPISGTITASYINEGSIAAGLLFVIEDVDNLRIITSFREYDVGRISEGMEVIITSDGTGDAKHIGEISRINPSAIAGSPIVEFESEITIVSEDTGLRLGMTTRIEIKLDIEEAPQ